MGREARQRQARTAQTLALGHALLAAGDLDGAQAQLQAALSMTPQAADTLALAGMLALARGQNDDAQGLLQRACELAPGHADWEIGRGRALFRLGQWTLAQGALASALALDTSRADAWVLLGLTLRRSDQLESAAEAFERAIALAPGDVAARINLGNVARALGDHQRAGACYRSACVADAHSAQAHYHLGIWLRDDGDDLSASRAFDAAVQIEPRYAPALFNLANVLCSLGRIEAALGFIDRALQLGDQDPALLLRCAAVLAEHDLAERSLELLERAGRLAQGDAAVLGNLGMAYQRLGRIDAALAAFDAALLREPEGSARLNRSLALLADGRWAEGWADYGARWRDPTLVARLGAALGCESWDGATLTGKTLLVAGEQGLGDEIMFASIVPEVVAEAAHVIVACSVKLERIFKDGFPQATVVGIDRIGSAWPEALAQRVRSIRPVEVFATLGDLARYRRGAASAFPRHAGYLAADPDRATYWRARLAALGPGAKIGLSWRGGTDATGRNRRSMALESLLPMLRRTGVHFVSLQYTECMNEIDELRRCHGVVVHHWPAAIDDYFETAALLCGLDGVVSVCTAVVHLAGALDVPVRVMAPAVPEWRYGRAGPGMIWYPSVRVERQAIPGDWTPVIAAVAENLPGVPLNSGSLPEP